MPVAVEIGPAMTALPDRWRQFCLAYYGNGQDGADAARACGYSDKSEGCKVRAYELLHNPRIIAALKELGDADFAAFAPTAIAAVKQIASNPQHQKQLDAAKYALGQAGYREVKDVNVRVEMTASEEATRLVELAKQLGRDPREFLGQNAIDVEFEEVTEPDEEPVIVEGEEY